MPAVMTNYADAVAVMPRGTRLSGDDISWEEYEDLLAAITDQPHFRISYDRGELEIMSTSSTHESWKVLFTHLLAILAEELNLNLYSLGSMTFKLPDFAQGVEPDDCFYIHRAAQIIGVEEIDLARDPGPELVVEIDLSSHSLDKFPIYANLGVEEVWRRNKRELEFYRHDGYGFQRVTQSELFPMLTSERLERFLLKGRQEGIVPMNRAFRVWVRAQQTK
ncbi:MAG: Uma2 family endonuclease [Acidobacteria bacterium]|nr:Uma2 family endonuclease [Acidobacteriota bacterium]